MTSDTLSRPSLFEAAVAGRSRTVEELIAAGEDLDVVDGRGRTAILLAAMERHYEVVTLLAAAGADIDKQDNTSLNPFLLGCTTNDVTLVRLMIDADADLTRLTRFGGNGLTPASEKGFLEIVRELLTRTDINVNHTNWVGWTALIEAIILNDGGPRQQRIVRLLLDHGADPAMTDKYGVTPRELAIRHGHTALAEIIAAAEG
ncbi:ankyrin repeat domain-containing protein [Microbacterium sp. SYP-A9085]|uniref:ankyrin repeat domain-containing protein n=1 Tax=Microbacterium sp. SYP-A9085 TaxID=2664454 RepID=UPI001C12C16D